MQLSIKYSIIIILLSLATGFISCENKTETGKEPVLDNETAQDKEVFQDKDTMPVVNQYKDADIQVRIFKVDSLDPNSQKGWGYDIMINGSLRFHQPNIPSIMGNNGFSNPDKARKAGEFVIYKIKNNILPPAVTPEELDSLGVLN